MKNNTRWVKPNQSELQPPMYLNFLLESVVSLNWELSAIKGHCAILLNYYFTLSTFIAACGSILLMLRSIETPQAT